MLELRVCKLIIDFAGAYSHMSLYANDVFGAKRYKLDGFCCVLRRVLLVGEDGIGTM